MTRHVDALFLDPETPRDLLSGVLARIAHARRRAARLRLAALGTGLLTILLAFIPAFSYAMHEFAASGFVTYLSLFFTDTHVALSYWRELSFTLFESLPSLALLMLASLITAFGWSVKRTVHNARVAFAAV